MKKLFLLQLSVIFIFAIVSCKSSAFPNEDGRQYTISGNSDSETIVLSLSTSLDLPSNRINDFLPTLEAIFNNFSSLDCYLNVSFYQENITKFSPPTVLPSIILFAYSNGGNIVVEDTGFDKDIVDIKNPKYYTSSIILNGTDNRTSESKDIEAKMYFRQLEVDKPNMVIMIMIKNDSGDHEYLTSVETSNVQIYKYQIDEKPIPLPDYLQ